MTSTRISSIDIMRGLTILLMLFVNDLYMPGVPAWLGHMDADFDGMGLADWVFPGFLFITGMAIPFAIDKRLKSGEPVVAIAKHIAWRSVSLIIIGVLMLNSGRVNPGLTHIGKNLWALLMYLGVFLVWNDYPKNDEKFFTVSGLKFLGLAILVILVMKFQSGSPENHGSLITGWWGILGLIGWGYLAAAFIFLASGGKIIGTAGAFLFFLLLNILSSAGLLSFLDKASPYIGILTGGNVPMIVIAGVIIAQILKKWESEKSLLKIATIITIGVASIVAGFILRRWFIISKIQATPSWGLICNGISMILFVFLYWLADIKGKTAWARFLKPAGENALTTYLAPDIIYYLIWSTGLHLFFYKQQGLPWLAIAGSLAWALLMTWLTALLVRFNIRLKL